MKRREVKELRAIAIERINVLLDMADRAAIGGDLDKADRYVEMARSIGMRTNVRIPREKKRRFCKYCYAYLLPGRTSKVRVNSKSGRVEVTCIKCERIMYYPCKRLH